MSALRPDDEPAGDLTRAQPEFLTPAHAAREALAHTREAALFTRQAVTQLLELAKIANTPPEFRPVVINPAASAAGPFVTTDKSMWEALSIGVYNPTNFPVFIGVGGVSPTAAARAPACSAHAVTVLPVRAYDLELGCDPVVLGAASAVVFLFRYPSVQPLTIGDAT